MNKPDKLTDKEFWDLYSEIADDILMDNGWELGDYLFIGGCIAGVIIIWEFLKWVI